MTSTQKQFNTIFSRSLSILKPDMAQVLKKVSDNKKNRRTTGNYNTNKATRRQDEVEFTATIFGPSVQVDGEDFTELIGGGRIQSRFKHVFLFVKTARAPDEWVVGLEQLNLLSDVKIEEAKYASH